MQNNHNILLLYIAERRAKNANTLFDHLDALRCNSRNSIYAVNFRTSISLDRLFSKLSSVVNYMDVVVIHYSIPSFVTLYRKLLSDLLKDFVGMKVVFIQDEYRYIDFVNESFLEFGIDVLFSCQGKDVTDVIYSKVKKESNVIIKQTFTGYIPQDLLKIKSVPIKKRKLHIAYRGRELPYYYGSISQEKRIIGEEFLKYAKTINLKCDINSNEKKRKYGKEWIKFLLSAKCTLGVESAISIADFRGEIFDKAPKYMEKYPNVPFQTIKNKFFPGRENKIKFSVISPRIFEAICLKTAMVLFEGRYSGVVIPWKHYIPLKKDFSNINEVCKLVADDIFLQKMVDNAYQDIALNSKYYYTYFAKEFDQVIQEEYIKRGFKKVKITIKQNFILRVVFFLSILRLSFFYYLWQGIEKIILVQHKVLNFIYKVLGVYYHAGHRGVNFFYKVGIKIYCWGHKLLDMQRNIKKLLIKID